MDMFTRGSPSAFFFVRINCVVNRRKGGSFVTRSLVLPGRLQCWVPKTNVWLRAAVFWQPGAYFWSNKEVTNKIGFTYPPEVPGHDTLPTAHWIGQGHLGTSFLGNRPVYAASKQKALKEKWVETCEAVDMVFRDRHIPPWPLVAADSGIQVRGFTLLCRQVGSFWGGVLTVSGVKSPGAQDTEHLATCGTFQHNKDLSRSKCQKHPPPGNIYQRFFVPIQLCLRSNQLNGIFLQYNPTRLKTGIRSE